VSRDGWGGEGVENTGNSLVIILALKIWSLARQQLTQLLALLAVYFAIETRFFEGVICDGVFHTAQVALDQRSRFRHVVSGVGFQGASAR